MCERAVIEALLSRLDALQYLVPETPRQPVDVASYAAAVAVCRRCELSMIRRKAVSGCGPASARLLIVGDGVDSAEESAETPFVGQAGALLDNILAAMQLNRRDVFLTPAVRCCPGNGQTVTARHISACRVHGAALIAVLSPPVVCCLGPTALTAVMGPGFDFSAVRGQWLRHGKTAVMPLFSPVHLLAHPEDKTVMWRDIRIVMRRMANTCES